MLENNLSNPRDEELRIALVMNGGVSLAVWIGGVAHEINRFVGETHPVYRQLLELTSTRARVDVVSGTSAGGINGAALALGCVYDKSLSSLRELWLSKGSFAELLRRADEKNPPSLLDGDGYFLPALQRAFQELTFDNPRKADKVPMDVSMTATMLHGESHTRSDDLGEPIEDSQHRAAFRFTRRLKFDPFDSPKTIAVALAKAARASASFPVAFEPHLFKRGEFENARTNDNGKFDRYLIDGGVLDNKPIRGALKSIYSMPATGNVRRVLAYVVPDPASGAKDDADTADDPPNIPNVAMASVLGIPLAQSIADQLSEIDEQNIRVRRKRHSFAWFASTLQASDLERMSDSLFPAYRERRIDGLLDYVLDEVYKGLQAKAPGKQINGNIALGRRTREWLKSQWLASDGAEAAWDNLIPNRENAWSFKLENDSPDSWTWGVYAIRFVESVVHDLLRRTQYLAHHISKLEDQSQAWPPIPTNDEMGNETDRENSASLSWDARDVSDRRGRNHNGPEGSLHQSGRLAGLWENLYLVLRDSPTLQSTDSEKIQKAGVSLIKLIATAQQNPQADDADNFDLNIGVTDWLQNCIKPSEARIRKSSKLAKALVKVLCCARDLIEEVCEIDDDQLRSDEKKALAELKSLYQLLLHDRPSPTKLVTRLLQLEIVYYAIAGRENIVDASVELVQISGRGASPWGGPSSPSEKLTGMQLAHFGAFYRKSWRANDWMMGRLDGIKRIIGIALNPDRLHRLYGGKLPTDSSNSASSSIYVYEYLHALAVDTALPEHRELLEAAWEEDKDAVLTELAFLDSRYSRVPETLPVCGTALTRRLHLEVICAELPSVARNTVDDVANGATFGKHAATLVSRVHWEMGPLNQRASHKIGMLGKWLKFIWQLINMKNPPKPTANASQDTFDPNAAIRTFNDCLVGSELLEQETSSDLLSRTATHAATVTHSALTGTRSGMETIGTALRVLNLPIRFLNLLANNLASESRTSATVSTTLLVSGFLFVLGSVLLTEPPKALAAVGWSMLLGWFAAIALRQTKRWWVLIFVVLLLGLYGLLTGFTGYELSDYLPAAVTGIIIFLAIFMPAWFFAICASVAALWWTTGHPTFAQIVAAACNGLPRGDDCGATSLIENGTLFIDAMGPMVAVILLSAIAHFGGRRRRSN